MPLRVGRGHFPFPAPLLALLLVVVALSGLRLSAGLPTNWISAFPGGAGGPVYNLYSFRDQVLVGRSRQALLSSLDGEFWSRANLPVNSSTAFLWANGNLYGLAGKDRYTFVSTNGRSWFQNFNNSTHEWTAAAYGNGRFLAAGTNGLDISKDALSWSQRPLPASPLGAGLVFAQDHFVLLSPEKGAWLSPDGTNWQSKPVDPNPAAPGEATHWGNLRCLNGLCFAVGSSPLNTTNGALAVSQDGGVNWTVQKPVGVFTLTDVAYAHGRYVMVGVGVIGHSDDGLHWTFDTTVTSESLVGVVHVRGRFITLDSKGGAYYSADGIHWDSPNFGGNELIDVAATTDGFIAVGNRGTILSSTNGADWTRENSGTRESLGGINQAGGLIFATGTKGTILSSPDGHTWTQRYSNTAVANFNLRGVTYARGRYLATGAWLSSTDGLTWRAASASPLNRGVQLIDDGSQFVLLPYPAYPSLHVTLDLSRDGQLWTIKDTGLIYTQQSDFADYGPSLAFGRGLYVLVGDHLIATSSNLANWTRVPTQYVWSRVIYTGDGFVAVDQRGYQGYSSDGAQWVSGLINAAGSDRLNSIAYRNGVYVAVGTNGRILYSRKDSLLQLTPVALLPGLGFHLTLRHAESLRNYTLQSSDQSGIWRNVGIINDYDTVLDPTATTNTLRLYRAIQR